jgi:hypothetical protein
MPKGRLKATLWDKTNVKTLDVARADETQGTPIRMKTFRDAMDSFSGSLDRTGDVSLAAYILQHCIEGDVKSIGAIGLASDAEFMLLHALAEPGSNFVYLNVDQRNEARQHLTGLANHLEAQGYGSRAVISDLMLPGRWASLLGALALGEVRVLGLDAAWAESDPHFWANLVSFLRATERAVYIRGLLDYRTPKTAMALLQTMPCDQDIHVIASTRGAVWLAAGAFATHVRHALQGSGLFGAGVFEWPGPVIVQNDIYATMIDQHGHVPAVVYRVSEESTLALEFGKGWSSQEADGCWTDGEEAVVSVAFRGGHVPTSLSIEGNPWMPPDSQQQVVEFGVGQDPATWSSLSFWQEEIASVSLPLQPGDWAAGKVLLHIRVQHPGRPSDRGGDDHRLLGFKLRSLGFFV